MIGLVWSLVSSVVEAARRRKLAIFLADFLEHVSNDGLMLVCRHIASISSSSSSSGISRYSSDPQLSVGSNTRSVLYRNERTEVTTEKAEPLKPSQWRFVKGSVARPTSPECRVFFVAERLTVNSSDISQGIADIDAVPYCSIFLDSSCERVGWHRFVNASLHSCPLERFIDVVYAFSENALFDNITDARLIDRLHTITIPYEELSENVFRTASPLAQSLTHLQQRPLSLLEQLYLGEARPWYDAREQFVSETALHAIELREYESLPRRLYRSPRRRYRSCTSELRKSEKSLSCLLPELEIQVAHFFDKSQSLPPFFRTLSQTYRLPPSIKKASITMESQTKAAASEANSDSVEISPSITIEEMDRQSDANRGEGSTGDIPFADDMDTTTSPRPIMEMTSQMALILKREDRHAEKNAKENGEEKPVAAEQSKSPSAEHLPNGSPVEAEMFERNPLRKEAALPPLANSQHSKLVNGSTLRKRDRIPFPPPATVTRRRHSAMVGHYGEDLFNENSTRFRSLSPMSMGAARIRHSVCESAFTGRWPFYETFVSHGANDYRFEIDNYMSHEWRFRTAAISRGTEYSNSLRSIVNEPVTGW